MLFGFLMTLFTINCLLLILLILIQQGKGGLGITSLGGQQQNIFGGSGGADELQKATWVFGAIFMAGSMMLSVYRAHQSQKFNYIREQTPMQQLPTLPTQPTGPSN